MTQFSKIDDKLFANTEDPYAPSVILDTFKEMLTHSTKTQNDAFLSGADVVQLMQQRTEFIDQLLIQAWQSIVHCNDLALVAVGGYGRKELHPASDIDLMILMPLKISTKVMRKIQYFMAFLWDIGLEVGQSVRTVRECVSLARDDITVATNIMESRFLSGSEKLHATMRQRTGVKKIWKTKKFFKAKLQEQIKRHEKYANTEYNLEPNIKEGPGGLRDIQVVDWVTKRHFSTATLSELIQHGFLTEKEYQTLAAGQVLLWRIRYALHVISNRNENRLLFEYQRRIADFFGFHATNNHGIEQFMKMYYNTVHKLSVLNEILLQRFQEAIIYKNGRKRIQPINKRFQIHNGFIEVCHENIFKHYPFALLEIFLLKQQILSIQGIRASTLCLIQEYTKQIDDDFRNDIRNKSLFMEIIKQPRYVGHELRRMHRFGVLSKYLPSFGIIEGQMQFDLFHTYSVDEHTLVVIQNMRFFRLRKYIDIYPLCYQISQKIPKQELLYIAALFHDIAKGRKGDHAKLGTKDAVDFCQKHGLSKYDTNIISWLVENHLLLSKTAQREDIDDPTVINNFAAKIGRLERLNYLYLLTVADVSGTNPNLWNEWKDNLFRQLYDKTKQALRHGLENPLHKIKQAKETKHCTLKLLQQYPPVAFDIEKFWAALDEDYFIRYSADEIAWHAQSIASTEKQKNPLIKIRQQPTRGGTEIFVFMKNQNNVFTATTYLLEQLQLAVVDARITMSTHGFTLHTYIILDKFGKPITEQQKKEVGEQLCHTLSNIYIPDIKITRPQSRKQRLFALPTHINLIPDPAGRHSIMEVNTADRIGLLSCIGLALTKCELRLHSIKIATYGSRVEDIFCITTKKNQPITKSQFKELQNLIMQMIV